MSRRALLPALVGLGLGLGLAGAAAQGARPGANLPNASNQPIAIEADRLEVRDREKVAVFAGGVTVTQGHTRMTASSMRVLYDGDVAPGAGGSASSIRRIEASGPIVVTQPDQTMTGQSAIYEMATRVIVVTGNVVLTQGRNVVQGPRLTLDMRTNHAVIERGAGGQGERPRMLLVPGEAPPPPAQPRR
jgi:lipopolysaccharide export system protein LptA